MSITPYVGSSTLAALVPILGNYLLQPRVIKAIAKDTAQFIGATATRDPTGAIMSRARTKIGMSGSGFPPPAKNTRMLVTDSVRDYSGSSSTPVVVRSNSGAYPVGFNGPARRAGRRKPRGSRVPRGISSYVDKITTCFRASPALVNTSAGVCSNALALAISSNFTGALLGPISQYITQWTALSALYREYRITRLTIDFVPRVASTVSGEISISVDRDPQAGLSAQSVVVRRNPFFQTDLKVPACLEWTPVDSKDREWRYTTVGASRSEEFLSFGKLLIASNNSMISGDTIGDLFINAWAEFAVPA